MFLYNIILYSLLSGLSFVHATKPDFLKRYANETVSLVTVQSNATTINVAAQQLSTMDSVTSSVNAGPSVTTITRRTTVTATSTHATVSTTGYPLSVLLDPLVAVVAAPAVDDANDAVVTETSAKAVVTAYQTIYLPTTIYITRPCTAVAAAAQTSIVQSAVTTVVTQTVTTSVSAAAAVTVAGTAGVAADSVDDDEVTANAVAPASVNTALVAGQNAQAVQIEQVTQTTVRVTQTLQSTTTIQIAAVSTALVSIIPPYANSTMSM